MAYKRISCDSTDIYIYIDISISIYIICRYQVTSSHMLQDCFITRSTDFPQNGNSEHYKQKRRQSVHRPEHSPSPECVCVCVCVNARQRLPDNSNPKQRLSCVLRSPLEMKATHVSESLDVFKQTAKPAKL